MKDYKLSADLVNQWQFYGFAIRYSNNKTSDIEISSKEASLYFDRINEYSLFTLTTNLSMKEEILKLCYKTLTYLNDIKRENNEEETKATKITWYDGDEEIVEEIKEI